MKLANAKMSKANLCVPSEQTIDIFDVNRYNYTYTLMTPRKLYNFYIDPELADGLKALKEKTGAPESESIRRALAVYLRKQGVIKANRKRASTRKLS